MPAKKADALQAALSAFAIGLGIGSLIHRSYPPAIGDLIIGFLLAPIWGVNRRSLIHIGALTVVFLYELMIYPQQKVQWGQKRLEV